MNVLSFAAGFIAGWFVRSTVDSSRDLFVELGARLKDAADGARRAILAEREFFEDLWAEAEARSRAEEVPDAHEAPPSSRVGNGEVPR